MGSKTLRKANINEAADILQFYQNIIRSIKSTEFQPKWSNDYPNLEYIEKSIQNNELYVCEENGNIIACAVLNNLFDPEYKDISWNVNAESDEITVIHTFAVDSNYSGKGIGKKIFNQIKENAIVNNKKSIRIDIIDGNLAAQKVFEKFGFEYVDTVEVFHKAVGLEKFHLYELVLPI
ncbi:N-acetyltransferase family protein [Methanobrevibacter sp.]